ncbi:MAG: hypothetical protein GY756_09975 [bacterium]|nr:hypothetical protein [bacterium]
MSFTGLITFFDRNKINKNSTFDFTTVDEDTAFLLYDNKNSPQLSSVGSADGVTEVLKVELDATREIDTIAVLNHNFKTGQLLYSLDDITYSPFPTPIAWVNNTDTNNVYSFSAFSVAYLALSITHTIDTGQKKVGEFRALTSLGSVESNPIGDGGGNPSFEQKANTLSTADGGKLKILFGQKFNAKLKFRLASENDYTLFYSLSQRNDPFYVYPCGGVDNSPIGYRIEDMYLVNYLNSFKYKLRNGLFSGVDIDVHLAEV